MRRTWECQGDHDEPVTVEGETGRPPEGWDRIEHTVRSGVGSTGVGYPLMVVLCPACVGKSRDGTLDVAALMAARSGRFAVEPRTVQRRR